MCVCVCESIYHTYSINVFLYTFMNFESHVSCMDENKLKKLRTMIE